MPLRNLTAILGVVILSLACYMKADRSRYAGAVADAMHKVRLYYVERVEPRQLFEDAMKGMVEGLDQYSAYISPKSFRQMEESLDQEFGGVGIEIEKSSEAEPLLVLSPLVGTPAYRAGLRAGDKILAIDGASTSGMSREDSVERMRGTPGSSVTLQVQHAGDSEPFEVTVVREVIVVQSVLGDTRRADGSWDFHLAEDPRIGYLRVTTFGKHTVEELRDVLSDAANQDFEALLVDLRGNAGGLLSAAVDTCDLFIDQGRIVSTRGRDGVVRSTYSATQQLAVPGEIPIALLVNNYSASASEIVAACLQDYARAIIVGERTWGKGTVQNLLELEGGQSALKLTTATYWRPSGENIHRLKDADESAAWGVRPNPGFEIILDEQETERVVLARRSRDVFQVDLGESSENAEPDAAATPADGVSEGEEPASGQGPVVDRQLERALEHLRGRLRELDADARTAAAKSPAGIGLAVDTLFWGPGHLASGEFP